MERNYRRRNVTTPSDSKIARQKFNDERSKIASSKKFIKELTSRKISGAPTVSESRLIKGKIEFAKNRMVEINKMSVIMSEFLSESTVKPTANRIIANYLATNSQEITL